MAGVSKSTPLFSYPLFPQEASNPHLVRDLDCPIFPKIYSPYTRPLEYVENRGLNPDDEADALYPSTQRHHISPNQQRIDKTFPYLTLSIPLTYISPANQFQHGKDPIPLSDLLDYVIVIAPTIIVCHKIKFYNHVEHFLMGYQSTILHNSTFMMFPENEPPYSITQHKISYAINTTQCVPTSFDDLYTVIGIKTATFNIFSLTPEAPTSSSCLTHTLPKVLIQSTDDLSQKILQTIATTSAHPVLLPENHFDEQSLDKTPWISSVKQQPTFERTTSPEFIATILS